MKVLKKNFGLYDHRTGYGVLLGVLMLCGTLSATEKGPAGSAKPPAATLVVAASDSADHVKAQADYICPGLDDHLVINTAIDALPKSGGSVYLAAGTYSIGGIKGTHGGITISRSNVLLTGTGRSARLILQGGLADINVIWIYGDNIRDVTVRDLYINGNGQKTTRNRGLGWAGCNGVKALGKTKVSGLHPTFPPRNIRVENCYIENCRLMAVMLTGDVVEVLGCNFSGDFGSHVVELLGWNGRIEGCTLRVKNGDSVGFGFSTDQCRNYHIINNKITVASGGQIRSHAINNWRRCYNGIITGNMVVNSGQSGPVRIQGYMDIVNNNIFHGVPVQIQGEGVIFGHNMLVNSPLEIKACVHGNVVNDDEAQWPIQVDSNWFCGSAVTKVAGKINLSSNQTTEVAHSGIVTMGGGTNEVVVEHGLGVAPAVVHVSAVDSAGAGMKCRVEEVTDRQFTLRVDTDPKTPGAAFYWKAATHWKDKKGRAIPSATR